MFESGEGFLLPGLQNAFGMGRRPAIRQEFAERRFVDGKNRRKATEHVGEIGGHRPVQNLGRVETSARIGSGLEG